VPRRVLILARHRLFASGLAALCAPCPDIQVVGSISSTRRLPQAVSKLKPDTVVVEGEMSDLGRAVECLSGVRVLTLTLDDNTLDIYERRHVEVAGARELLAAIAETGMDALSVSATPPVEKGPEA
jgi:DNA-binding NarL/FixJ family response regulator